MKRTSLPPTALGRTEAPNSQSTHSQGLPSSQGPQLSALASGPNYQDMADNGPQVQAAQMLQHAADAMAEPMPEGPALQGFFKWKGQNIDEKHFPGFMATNANIFMNARLASALRKSPKSPDHIEAQAELADMWKDLKDLAKDDEDWGEVIANKQSKKGNLIPDEAQLIELLRNYQAVRAMRMSQTAENEASGHHEEAEDSDADTDQYDEMGRQLAELGVFPLNNIRDLVKKAQKEGRGFITEINLALRMAQAHPNAKVQVGTVPPGNLKGFLGYAPTPSQDKVLGQAGGDVTVWYNPALYPDEKTFFIQAKRTFVPKNIDELMGDAGRQLTGNNASGATSGNQSAVKEGTFTGPSYQGVAFGRIEGDTTAPKLKEAANNAFAAAPKHCLRVVFEIVDHTGISYVEFVRIIGANADAKSEIRGPIAHNSNPLDETVDPATGRLAKPKGIRAVARQKRERAAKLGKKPDTSITKFVPDAD